MVGERGCSPPYALGREEEPAHAAGRELALDHVRVAERELELVVERGRHGA